MKVVYQPGSALQERVARRLAARIQAITGTRVAAVPGAAPGSTRGDDAVVLGRFGAGHLVPVVGDADAGRVRGEGYLLRCSRREGARLATVAAACDEGVKFGAWHLLRELDFAGGRMAAGELDVVENPFLRERHVIVSDPFDQSLSEDPVQQEKYCWGSWPVEKIIRYVDALDEMGLNGLIGADLPTHYWLTGFRVSPDEVSMKLTAMFRHAREIGQSCGLFLWGNALQDLDAPDRQEWVPRGLCRHDERQCEELFRLYDYQAERYATLVDYVMTHWGDPGGCDCGRCTIETAQQLHNVISGKMRAFNPSMRSYFSLWMLDNKRFGKWAGYRDVDTILKGGILPAEVGLAQHGRFDLEQARRIRAAGREVGTFTWYLADNEIYPAWHVHARYQQEYFSSLPAETSELLRMHSLDSNCQGLNLASLYVGARLMWNPKRKAEDLLAEFCRAVFGPRAAPRVLRILSAIEGTRCRSDYGRLRAILHLSAHHDVEDDPGSAEEALEMVREARHVHEATSLDRDFVPRLDLPVSPEFLLAELGPQLAAIEDYAQFRLDLERCQAGKLTGAKLAARLGRRSVVAPRPGFLIGLERHLCRGHLRKHCSSTAPESAGTSP